MHRPVILSLRENEKTPTMVTWSGSNSGRLNPPLITSPPRLMPRKPVVLRNMALTGGCVEELYSGPVAFVAGGVECAQAVAHGGVALSPRVSTRPASGRAP